ncbi:WD40 repeat-like protein, partial [Coniophora puteana RWD-64-598 SS2]
MLEYASRSANQTSGDLPFSGHAGRIRAIEYSPDNRFLATAGEDATVRLWNPDTGKLIRFGDVLHGPLLGHVDVISSTCFSWDGQLVLDGSHAKTLCVWDSSTGDLRLRPFKGHSGSVTCIEYSPDNRFLATGGDDGTIQLWNLRTGEQTQLMTPNYAVRTLSICRFSRHMVAGSLPDGGFQIWDTATGATIQGPLRGPIDMTFSICFSSDASWAIDSAESRTICVWDTSSGALVTGPLRHDRLQGGIRAVACSPLKDRIACLSDKDEVVVWDAKTNEVVLSSASLFSTLYACDHQLIFNFTLSSGKIPFRRHDLACFTTRTML